MEDPKENQTLPLHHRQEKERHHTITIHTLNDTIPELDETFTCHLQQPTGGGNLGNSTMWMVTIGASDKPHGVVSIPDLYNHLVMKEPESTRIRWVKRPLISWTVM